MSTIAHPYMESLLMSRASVTFKWAAPVSGTGRRAGVPGGARPGTAGGHINQCSFLEVIYWFLIIVVAFLRQWSLPGRTHCALTVSLRPGWAGGGQRARPGQQGRLGQALASLQCYMGVGLRGTWAKAWCMGLPETCREGPLCLTNPLQTDTFTE